MSIEIGKYADMIILDANLLEVNAADMSGTKVLQTLLNGDVVYDASTDMAMLENAEAARLTAFANLTAAGHVCALHNTVFTLPTRSMYR